MSSPGAKPFTPPGFVDELEKVAMRFFDGDAAAATQAVATLTHINKGIFPFREPIWLNYAAMGNQVFWTRVANHRGYENAGRLALVLTGALAGQSPAEWANKSTASIYEPHRNALAPAKMSALRTIASVDQMQRGSRGWLDVPVVELLRRAAAEENYRALLETGDLGESDDEPEREEDRRGWDMLAHAGFDEPAGGWGAVADADAAGKEEEEEEEVVEEVELVDEEPTLDEELDRIFTTEPAAAVPAAPAAPPPGMQRCWRSPLNGPQCPNVFVPGEGDKNDKAACGKCPHFA